MAKIAKILQGGQIDAKTITVVQNKSEKATFSFAAKPPAVNITRIHVGVIDNAGRQVLEAKTADLIEINFKIEDGKNTLLFVSDIDAVLLNDLHDSLLWRGVLVEGVQTLTVTVSHKGSVFAPIGADNTFTVIVTIHYDEVELEN